MDPEFWKQAWEDGRTGFHVDEVHPDLMAHADAVLGTAKRVLVPLCGRSRDLAWLAERGHEVVGAELYEPAVRGLFSDAGLDPLVRDEGAHIVYRAGRLTVWCGNFFSLPDRIGPFDAVWDRASLVALPPDARAGYVARVMALAPGGTMLLNALSYDPTVMGGPPFSVDPDDVQGLYGGDAVEMLDDRDDIHKVPRFRELGHRWWRTTVYRIRLDALGPR